VRRRCARAQLLAAALARRCHKLIREKPIRLVVPVAAGGSSISTRGSCLKALRLLGRTVIVDNRPGRTASSAQISWRIRSDGYTLLMGATPTMAINVTLYAGKMPYNPEQDFTPITMVAKAPSVLAAHPSVPAKTSRS
jgi:tripartite-type tricarboxylate transporter receptor subunit TctC